MGHMGFGVYGSGLGDCSPAEVDRMWGIWTILLSYSSIFYILTGTVSAKS